jgi:uncharacterized protein (DUF1330 family)
MAKGYWITAYRKVSDPEKLAAYAKLAGPALVAAGGRFLARGTASKVYEAGLLERTVLIEFDSVEKAVAAYETLAYQAAIAALGNGAERDLRIVSRVVHNNCITSRVETIRRLLEIGLQEKPPSS